MGVAVILLLLERLVLWIIVSRGLVKQRVDGGCDKLHVPNLLRRDRGDELVEAAELLLGLHGHGLMEVVVEGRHFAKATTHEFLDGGGSGRASSTLRNSSLGTPCLLPETVKISSL